VTGPSDRAVTCVFCARVSEGPRLWSRRWASAKILPTTSEDRDGTGAAEGCDCYELSPIPRRDDRSETAERDVRGDHGGRDHPQRMHGHDRYNQSGSESGISICVSTSRSYRRASGIHRLAVD
jgi:hypothetical protein